MKIIDTVIKPDGTIDTIEIEVADNYFDPPAAPQLTPDEQIAELSATVDMLTVAMLEG